MFFFARRSAAIPRVRFTGFRTPALFRPELMVLLFVLVSGCASESKKPGSQPRLQTPWSQPDDAARPSTAIDPCADRLHDLCNPLLMHYALYRRMPDQLGDVRRITGPDPSVILECPVSKQTYVYNPAGLVSPYVQGRIILYDPVPVHDNTRRAVVIEDTPPGQPLIPRVITIPEHQFPRPPRTLPSTQPEPAAQPG